MLHLHGFTFLCICIPAIYIVVGVTIFRVMSYLTTLVQLQELCIFDLQFPQLLCLQLVYVYIGLQVRVSLMQCRVCRGLSASGTSYRISMVNPIRVQHTIVLQIVYCLFSISFCSIYTFFIWRGNFWLCFFIGWQY